MKIIRLTIAKRKKYKRKQKQIIIILFIIVPLVSVILGYILTKNVIAPYWNKESQATEKPQVIDNDKKESEVKNDNSKVLNSIEIYSVEVERFKSLEEAKKFIIKLNKGERLAYISQDQEYVVYSGLTLDKKEADLQETLMKEKYPQVILKSVETAEKNMDIGLSEDIVFKNMKETLKLLESSYQDELSIWIQDIKDIDYDILKEKIDENNSEISESIKEYDKKFESEDVKSKDLIELYLNLEKNIENRENVLKEFENRNIEGIRKTYYDYVESLFNYINYYKI